MSSGMNGSQGHSSYEPSYEEMPASPRGPNGFSEFNNPSAE
jgi:hypothetical protein